MAVLIGSARMDEHRKLSGGAAGDQTGIEVSTQNWYLSGKGWVVLRAKDPAKAEKIAQDMQMACKNNHIGYDQSQNTSLYKVVKPLGYDCSKVETNCETDCAKLVRVCVLYAGIDCGSFTTANEPAVLMGTGQFEQLTAAKYTESPDYLKRGDILCTKTKGHTVVVLSDGSKVKAEAPASNADVAKAQSYDKAVAGKYRITAKLYLRKAPVDGEPVLIMQAGKIARCYGYYTDVNGLKWLYVQYSNYVGFCSSKFLRKE